MNQRCCCRHHGPLILFEDVTEANIVVAVSRLVRFLCDHGMKEKPIRFTPEHWRWYVAAAAKLPIEEIVPEGVRKTP
jgi:hypothetical protein